MSLVTSLFGRIGIKPEPVPNPTCFLFIFQPVPVLFDLFQRRNKDGLNARLVVNANEDGLPTYAQAVQDRSRVPRLATCEAASSQPNDGQRMADGELVFEQQTYWWDEGRGGEGSPGPDDLLEPPPYFSNQAK